MSTKFPRSGLAVCGAVSCFGHVLSILASIYTHCVVEHPTWPCWPRSPGSLCVACKSFSYTGQGSEPLAERATEVPVTVPLHAWSGQGQLTDWTLTSDNIQSVGEGTHHHHQVRMAKKAGGRKTSMYSPHTHSFRCRAFEQPETRVEVSNSLSECVV